MWGKGLSTGGGGRQVMCIISLFSAQTLWLAESRRATSFSVPSFSLRKKRVIDVSPWSLGHIKCRNRCLFLV